jgi:hypothetical protein
VTYEILNQQNPHKYLRKKIQEEEKQKTCCLKQYAASVSCDGRKQIPNSKGKQNKTHIATS